MGAVKKFDRKGLAAFLRRKGNVIIWATRHGAIVKYAAVDGIQVYPVSELDDDKELDRMVEEIRRKADEGCRFRVINGTDGLACLSPETLRQIPEEADFIPDWNLDFAGDRCGEIGEAKVEDIVAGPMSGAVPQGPHAGARQAAESDEDEAPGEQAAIAADQPARTESTPRKLEEMPETAMYGWLGRKARELDTPLGFAYPAMLTAFAPLLEAFPKQVRPTLYTCLAGPVHCGKSETIKRSLASLDFPDPETVKWTVPGSDRGLINIFGAKKKPKKKDDALGLEAPKPRLLAQDELRNVLAKADINASSLTATLCSLWSQDEAGAADKTGEHIALVRLSILGALKADDPEDFAEVFGKQLTSGLYDRFVFGIAPSGWKYNPWEANKQRRAASRPDMPPERFQLLAAWRDKSSASRGRLGEIALRIAYISAAANQDEEVNEECMRAALVFAEWQEAIRSGYKAGLGDTLDAIATNAILIMLEKAGGKWVAWRRVAQRKN